MRISYPIAIFFAIVTAAIAGKHIGKDMAPTVSSKLEVRYVAEAQ